MRKEITGRLFVSINGEDVLWDTISKEMQKEISIEINKRAVTAFYQAKGYTVKVKDKTA